MSERPSRGTLRIVGGAQSARLVVSTAGGSQEAVPDSWDLAARRAHDEGYQAGHQAAAAEAQTELDAHREAIVRLTQRLPAAWEADLQRLEDSLRETVVDLAFQVAEAVLRNPVQCADAVRSAISEALSVPLIDGTLDVRCHPADAAVLGAVPPGDGRFRVLADPQLQPGDAWIGTPDTGDLDGRLDGRLAILRERLIELVRAPGQEQDAAS